MSVMYLNNKHILKQCKLTKIEQLYLDNGFPFSNDIVSPNITVQPYFANTPQHDVISVTVVQKQQQNTGKRKKPIFKEKQKSKSNQIYVKPINKNSNKQNNQEMTVTTSPTKTDSHDPAGIVSELVKKTNTASTLLSKNKEQKWHNVAGMTAQEYEKLNYSTRLLQNTGPVFLGIGF